MPNENETIVDSTNNEIAENAGDGIGEGEAEDGFIKVPKTDWEKTNQTLGSLKRELKDLRKAKDEPKETSQTNKPDENRLVEKLEKMALRQAGITHEDDIELARNTAKKWGVDVDEVLADEDFKVKLERLQNSRANVDATSNIKGGNKGGVQAKNTAEYWIAKGVPPTAADVPDRKTRASIARTMMANSKTSKTFYNE